MICWDDRRAEEHERGLLVSGRLGNTDEAIVLETHIHTHTTLLLKAGTSRNSFFVIIPVFIAAASAVTMYSQR